MPLPVSLTRHADIPGTSDVRLVADRLARGLELLGARRMTRTDRQIRFTAGLFRPVSAKNMLVTVSSGELTIMPFEGGLRITYHLRFTQWLTITGVAMLVLAAFSLAGRPPPTPGTVRTAAAVAGIGWLWIFGFNVLRTLYQVPRWIRRTVAADAP